MRRAEDLQAALMSALDRYGWQDRARSKHWFQLPQPCVKSVGILLADEMVGTQPGAKPTIYANRVEERIRHGKTLRNIAFSKSTSESMLDVTVFRNDSDPYQTLLTMESEAYVAKPPSPTCTSDNNALLWDLYKLLQVPSPVRVFLTRHLPRHHDTILCHVGRLVESYRSAYRPGDEILAIVLPSNSGFCIDDVSLNGWLATRRGLRSAFDHRRAAE